MSVKDLYKSQLGLQKQIHSAYSNFKKSPKERLTWNYVQTKLDVLENYWGSFQTNHKQLLQHFDQEDFDDDAYLETYFSVEDEYALAKDLMLTKLSDLTPKRNEQKTESSMQPIKLPPIQIPKFDGQYSDWTSFHDQFVSLVHLNNTLDNVNKLHMLKQNLVGEAANLLKNITVTENNYEHAWNKLKKRYSNKRIIVNSYLQKLTSLRNITNESSQAIKNLLDTATDCLTGLKSIDIDTSSWDPIIIYMLTNKLDSESIKHWEELVSTKPNEELPTFQQFSEFLEMRFRSLEGVQSSRGYTMRTATKTNPDRKVFHSTPKEGCVVCGGDHYIFRCKQFIEMPIPEKKVFIERNNLCFNCLIPNHGVKNCKQRTHCRICGKRHHSLIHVETKPPEKNEPENKRKDTEQETKMITYENVSTHHAIENKFTQRSVLLATAIVKVVADNGRTLQLRALIDQGSEGSFITERATQTLGLRKNTVNGTITGLGNNVVMQVKSSVSFTIQSDYDTSLQLPVNAHVLTSLTRLLPSRQVNTTWSHLQGLTLADPEYGKPEKIDLLLGAEVYSRIMLDGIVSGSEGSPLAQRTRFGWVLTGEVYSTNSTTATNMNNYVINMHITTQQEEIDQLQKFWVLESDDYKHTTRMTEEEIKCEKMFAETYKRDREGRFIVEIPLKNKDYDFGDTKQIAEKRLEQLERRLNKNNDLKQEYTKVLMEYLELKHMEEIHTEDINNTKGIFYMPHHAVVRLDKTTSKLRIVFDASCKGPNNKSLNENMLIGPKLQQDLKHIVMRWRIHEIAFIADCIKMYRQVKVTDESANYQRILWRVNGKIKTYRLNRVTFGTASAPYLATKTLQQLAIDEEQQFPEASLVTKSDFYMDDLLSGADNLEEAYDVYKQMTGLMKAGGFELQKWASNKTEFIERVEKGRTNNDDNYVINSKEVIKTLGIKWNKATDTFQYDINSPSSTKSITKRLILSEISRLFDPMGWLAPVIVTAKVMIQKLWLARVTWDEEVPTEIKKEWLKFREDLEETKQIKIERWIQTNNNDQGLELHGYCDASQMAYAAVIYIRVIKEDGSIYTRLLTAKTRVAPIKTVSVPRLELCGAVLLTKLLREVGDVLNVPQKNIHAYTDSSIVLA